VARGPGRSAGVVYLILRHREGRVVFVAARTGRRREAGGAAASVSPAKQARLIYAAQYYLARLPRVPPCRFDVVAIDGDELAWLRAAFDLG
jgi:putative endonuclease